MAAEDLCALYRSHRLVISWFHTDCDLRQNAAIWIAFCAIDTSHTLQNANFGPLGAKVSILRGAGLLSYQKLV